jgi:hypothetical protein
MGDLQAEFAVRRLAAALALGQGCFFGGEVHGRAGEHFVDVAAHDATAVGAVPIALDDHGAAALGARLGGGFLQSGHRFKFLLDIGCQLFTFEDRKKDLETSNLLARPSCCLRG